MFTYLLLILELELKQDDHNMFHLLENKDATKH